MKKQVLSFKSAIAGLIWVIKTQLNFKIHLFLSLLSIVGGLYFQITYVEFLVIAMLITFGLIIEVMNTAIEEAIDAIHEDWLEKIRIAKDVSAAAMLIFSIGAFTIACIIFIPHIVKLLL
ncbi:diacylglycerol kinase family protein [Candidatus Roizmanbacteria bacterium]|nr:diacylglycerol kinase family protein [Candidatus Roizmanbacteria bacterium]